MRSAWALFGVPCVAAGIASATAKPLPQPAALDEQGRRQAYSIFAGEEMSMRKQAQKDWAADPWSQDDAFHNLEHQRAWGLAGTMKTSEAEILRAVDDGMRENWPRFGIVLRTTVPPCRPRPITD